MTNFLSTAMLSAGAACFGSIIEIEKNMAQAEIQTLIASEEMIKAQPLLMTALQNTYKAKADDQYASGLISGFGSIAAGGVQLGIVGLGGMASSAAAEAEGAEASEMRATSTLKPEEKATVEVAPKEEVVDALSKSQPTTEQDAHTTETNVARKEVVAEQAEQNTADTTKEAKEAQAKREKAASRAYKESSTYYSNLSQVFGPMINGAFTAIKTPKDTDLIQKDGTAQALSTVIQGNQTAQSSNSTMVQTYKDAFTNASQVLAGIVSAQRN